LGRGSPFNVSYQNCCKKKHICQWFSKFSFCYFTFCNRVASLWFIWVTKSSESTKKCISRGIILHTVVAHFQLWEIFCRSWHAEHFCSLNFPSISNSFWRYKMKVLKFRAFWWKKGNNSKMGKAKKKYMCVYCHMSKKSRVGRSGQSGLIFFLLSAKPEIVVPGSGIGFQYFFFKIFGKMTNYAVFQPSLLSISTKS
jgi:hypothetical protein